MSPPSILCLRALGRQLRAVITLVALHSRILRFLTTVHVDAVAPAEEQMVDPLFGSSFSVRPRHVHGSGCASVNMDTRNANCGLRHVCDVHAAVAAAQKHSPTRPQVNGVSRAAYHMHEPQKQPLKDLGFMILPVRFALAMPSLVKCVRVFADTASSRLSSIFAKARFLSLPDCRRLPAGAGRAL